MNHFLFFPLLFLSPSLPYLAYVVWLSKPQALIFKMPVCVLVLLAAKVYCNIYGFYKILYHFGLPSEELYAREHEVFMLKSSVAVFVLVVTFKIAVLQLYLNSGFPAIYHASPDFSGMGIWFRSVAKDTLLLHSSVFGLGKRTCV